MFQSNKEYIDFLIQSGVHTFLKETPNNLIKTGLLESLFGGVGRSSLPNTSE